MSIEHARWRHFLQQQQISLNFRRTRLWSHFAQTNAFFLHLQIKIKIPAGRSAFAIGFAITANVEAFRG